MHSLTNLRQSLRLGGGPRKLRGRQSTGSLATATLLLSLMLCATSCKLWQTCPPPPPARVVTKPVPCMEKLTLALEPPTIPEPNPDGSITLSAGDMRRLLEVVYTLRVYIEAQLDRCRVE